MLVHPLVRISTLGGSVDGKTNRIIVLEVLLTSLLTLVATSHDDGLKQGTLTKKNRETGVFDRQTFVFEQEVKKREKRKGRDTSGQTVR